MKIYFCGSIKKDALFAEKVESCYRCKTQHIIGENYPVALPTLKDPAMSFSEQNDAPLVSETSVESEPNVELCPIKEFQHESSTLLEVMSSQGILSVRQKDQIPSENTSSWDPDLTLPLQGNNLSNGTNPLNEPISKDLSKNQITKRNEEPFPNPTPYKEWLHISDLFKVVPRKPLIKDQLINSLVLYSKKTRRRRLDKLVQHLLMNLNLNMRVSQTL